MYLFPKMDLEPMEDDAAAKGAAAPAADHLQNLNRYKSHCWELQKVLFRA